MRRQCELLGTSRSGWYYLPKEESPENLRLMRRLDELNLENPEYGRPRLTALLRREGWPVNQKRIHRLMSVMGMEAIYPRQRTSQPEPMNEIYPYLRSYEDGRKLRLGLRHWFVKYNQHPPHQALGYATPEEVYHAPESHGAKPATWA